MAKPAITKRTTKGLALTYSELDTNFQNLADATLTLTAGTGGTAVTADLNGNITVVAGTNITLTGNNTAKTITINSTGGGGLESNNILVGNNVSGVVVISSQTNNTGLELSSSGGAQITVFDGGNILYQTTNNQTHTFSGSQGITLSPTSGSEWPFYTSGTQGIFLAGEYTKLKSISTTERNAISAQNGMIVYNSTTNKFQGYANGSWIDLH
jgi:hypothetical protein